MKERIGRGKKKNTCTHVQRQKKKKTMEENLGRWRHWTLSVEVYRNFFFFFWIKSVKWWWLFFFLMGIARCTILQRRKLWWFWSERRRKKKKKEKENGMRMDAAPMKKHMPCVIDICIYVWTMFPASIGIQ